MVSTVRARPNHYETLGLQPTATIDEIEQAFAREISVFRPRPFGTVASVSTAYVTLRDPAKRRAYDASIGIAPKPSPATRSYGSQFACSAHFIGSGVGGLSPRPEHDRFPPLPQAPRSWPELAAEPGTAPLIVREPSLQRAEVEQIGDAEDHRIEWKRPAIIIGGLALAAGLIGVGAGVVAGNDAEVEVPQRATTVKLPRAKPLPIAQAPASETRVSETRVPETSAPETQRRYERPRHAAAAHRRIRASRVPELHDLTPQELEELPPVEVRPRVSEGATGVTQQAVPEAPAPAAMAAKMPLPNAVIARTIGRIGYACGQVASTSAVEGQSGVFKVTCTSGHSYQAAPVRGRYHFRRLSNR